MSAAGVKTQLRLPPTSYSVEGIVKVTAVKEDGKAWRHRLDDSFGPDGNTSWGGVSQTRIVRKGLTRQKMGTTADAAARARRGRSPADFAMTGRGMLLNSKAGAPSIAADGR